MRVITIDGPSASGKTTVSRNLARQLDYEWVSTGVFYRIIAYSVNEEGVSPENESSVVDLIRRKDWSVELTLENTLALYKGNDVTPELHRESVGNTASKIAQLPLVRKEILEPQRECVGRARKGLIAEGRDCGTVVFPEAELKIYLDANQEQRVARRAKEEGVEASQLTAHQQERDERDSKRQHAPLQVSEGAHIIDSSQMSLDQVVSKILEIAKSL